MGKQYVPPPQPSPKIYYVSNTTKIYSCNKLPLHIKKIELSFKIIHHNTINFDNVFVIYFCMYIDNFVHGYPFILKSKLAKDNKVQSKKVKEKWRNRCRYIYL